jgi:hypothetical protein
MVGQGGFAQVFRGLHDGTAVAVKRMTTTGHAEDNDFLREISIIANVHHRSLVRLLGYCIQRGGGGGNRYRSTRSSRTGRWTRGSSTAAKGAGGGASCRGRRGAASPSTRPGRSRTSTTSATSRSYTSTSSRATSCSTATSGRTSRTSASPCR